MMRSIYFLTAVLLAGISPLSAQTSVLLGPPGTSGVTTNLGGGMSITSGIVGGTPYNATTTYLGGGFAVTNGTVGGQPFSGTTMNLSPPPAAPIYSPYAITP